jgi:ribosome-binding factor A
VATRRQQKVAELLHEELSMLIHQAGDPRLALVTVTDVEVTPDLRLAHVFVSVLGDENEVRQALAGLNHAAGFLRRELGASVSLRYLPELHFRLDDSLDRGMRVERLLSSLEDESPPGAGDEE